MTHQELLEIALHAANKTAPDTYTVENVDKAFLDGLKELAGSVNQFMKNRYDIYDIIIKTADLVMPKKVIDAIGIFAEVQQVPQGQKAMFKRKLGRNRAKKFLTQVGLSGVYETFRLDSMTFEVPAHAVGGGATIDFERMLDGAESLAEVMDVITEGLTDAVYVEVQRALKASISAKGPYHTAVSINTFDASKMVKLISIMKSYGNNAVIFAPPEFIAAMGPDAIVPVGTFGDPVAAAIGGVYHPQDIDAIHNTGYINLFRGTPVVQIPQSYIDEFNEKTWIDPQIAYVLPTGGEKVVKVVLEGETQINDFKNRDNSLEVFAYKKMGCAILTQHDWAIYQNTGIPQTMDTPWGY